MSVNLKGERTTKFKHKVIEGVEWNQEGEQSDMEPNGWMYQNGS